MKREREIKREMLKLKGWGGDLDRMKVSNTIGVFVVDFKNLRNNLTVCFTLFLLFWRHVFPLLPDCSRDRWKISLGRFVGWSVLAFFEDTFSRHFEYCFFGMSALRLIT